MNQYLNLADNPLFVKHVRSRLRRGTVNPQIIIMIFLCSCITFLAYYFDDKMGFASSALFFLQGIVLFLMGGSQVATAVSYIKDSGVIDFHRITPVPSSVQVVGFLFGAPIREYILFAVSLPFALICSIIGEWGLENFAKLLLVQLTAAFFYHMLGVVAGMTGKNAKTASGRAVGLIIGLQILSNATYEIGHGPVLFSPLVVFREIQRDIEIKEWEKKNPVPAVQPMPVPAGPPQAAGKGVKGNPQQQFAPQPWMIRKPERVERKFFSLDIPVAFQVLMFQVSVGYFLLLSASRRFRSNRLLPFSKLQALGFFATICFLTLGSMWDAPLGATIFVCIYALLVFGLWLSSSITVSLGDYVKGLARAARANVQGVPIWTEFATVRVAVLLMGLLFAVTPAIGAALVNPNKVGNFGANFEPWYPIAAGTFSFLAFSWALQYFTLHYYRRAKGVFVLFIFATWLAPLILGGILLAVKQEVLGAYVLSISPLFGIVACSGLPNIPQADQIMFAICCIGPQAVMSFLFFTFLLSEERKLTRVHQSDIAVKEKIEVVG